MSECGPDCNCPEAQEERAKKDRIAKALGASRTIRLKHKMEFLDGLMFVNQRAISEFEKVRDNCKNEN